MHRFYDDQLMNAEPVGDGAALRLEPLRARD